MNDENNRTYKQTRDLLALAQRVYGHLAAYYSRRESQAEDGRLPMLMVYMKRHENHMEKTLSETMAEVPKEVLDTYYQFTPEEMDTLDEIDCWRINPNIDQELGLDDMIAKVMRFDRLLRNFYARAAAMAPTGQVAAVFRNLKRWEEDKRNKQARDALSLKDL